jgi:hypothetical protein
MSSDICISNLPSLTQSKKIIQQTGEIIRRIANIYLQESELTVRPCSTI